MLATKAIEDIVDDGVFWQGLEQLLAQRMVPLNERALLMGIDAAMSMGVIVDLDSIHAPALEMARTTSNMWWSKMTETTREALRQSLITWVETGIVTPGQQRRGLRTLIDGLEPMFGDARAKRVAVTETTRLFGEGNIMAAREDDAIGGMQWQTGRNEQQVCAVCWPKNKLIYPKNAVPLPFPPHPNCYCGLIPVSWSYIYKHPNLWQGPPLGPRLAA
jgi:hypothetical protein